jgi:hypothetical protein
MFTKTKLLLAFLAAFIVVVVVSLTLNLPNNLTPKENTSFQATEYPATVAQSIRSCGSTFQFDIDPEWYGTIPENYTGRIPLQPMVIPAYGFMSDKPFNKDNLGFHTKDNLLDSTEVNRALWEGVTIVWYEESATPTTLKEISVFADERNAQGLPMMVLPHTLSDKKIPYDRSYAFSNWGVTQSCATFDIPIFDTFRETAAGLSPERDEINPPAAVLTPNGSLPEIDPPFFF